MTTTPLPLGASTVALSNSWMNVLNTFLSKLTSSINSVTLGESNMTIAINQQGFLFNFGLNNLASSSDLGASNQSLILKNLANKKSN